MRGLTVLASEASRLRGALELACAAAALGGRARLFCHGPAVSGLHPPIMAADDWHYLGAGLPPLATLVEEALALGVSVTLCQTGLQLTGGDAAVYDPRFAWSGLVGTMQTLGDDRLVFA